MQKSLIPGKGPATQLLEMWWAEQYSPGQYGVIGHSTYTLIKRELVKQREDGLSVELTEEGRSAAQSLAGGEASLQWEQLLRLTGTADSAKAMPHE